MLIKCVQATKGDVCELGCGFYSTALLHWLTQGRKLVTYESSPEYLHYARKFQSYNHRVRHLDSVEYDRKWSVVFIDHYNKPVKRGEDALKFTNADILILHDTEPEEIENYGYAEVLSKYKYRQDWTDCKPYTTVLSNTIDLKELFKNEC